MNQNSSSRWLIAVVVSAMIILLTGGTWFYRAQQHELQQHAEDELQAVVQLKVDQIVAWRAERLGDAELLTESPILVEAATRWMVNPQTDSTEDLLAQFRALQTHYNYYEVVLVDVDGIERLNLRGDLGPLHAAVGESLAVALRDHQPVLTDLHSGPNGLPPHIGAIAPLFANNGPFAEPVGAIILQSDASQFLYPMIQSWPTPSSTAETLLVRQDGDSVLFLNELRHQKGTALTLRIPLDQIDLPAAKAVQGYQGITQGKDYRGVEVVSAVQSIPDSPWFIIAKVDKSEIFADWQLYSRLIVGLFLGTLIAVGTAGGGVWQRNQKIHYRALLLAQQARQESETRYETTLLSIGDGVIVTDAEGQVVLLNPVAEMLTGWSVHEARGKPLEDVFHIISEETRQLVESPARRVMREGVIVGLANHTLLITKDGQEIPIADSGAPTYDAGGSLNGVVLVFRDQTEERAAQKALRDSEAYIRTILDNLPVGVAVNSADPTVTFSYMNDNFVRYYRTTRKALVTPDAFWEAVYEDTAFRETIRTRVLEDIASGDPERMHWEDIPVTRQGAETTFISARNTPIHSNQLMLSTVWDTTERKRAETTLRESEERFRRAIADAPFPMLIHAETGEIVVVNQTWTDITGYTHADIPTIDAWTERAYGERKAIVQEDIDRLYSMQKRQAEGEYVITTHCGEKRTWDFSSSPIGQLSDGRRLVLSMAMDVTERKRAENQLRESEASFRLLFESNPQPMWVYDLETLAFLEVNDSAIDHYGYSHAEFLSMTLVDIRPPEDVARLSDDIQRERPALQHSGEWQHRLKNGQIIDVEITSHTLEFAGRRAALVVAQDITERRRAEEMLRLQSAALRSAANAIVITDPNGTIEWVNPAFTVLAGYSLEESWGHNPRDLVRSGMHDDAFYKELWDAILTGKVWHGELINRRKDGSLYSEEQTVTPVLDKDGTITHFVAIKQDVTARKQAEQAVLASETRYRRLFEAAKDGILILDADTGKVVDANPFLLDLLGYSHAEILGKEMWEIGVFEDIVASQAAFLELQEAGYIRYEDMPLETKDGRSIEVEFVSNVYAVNSTRVIQCNIRDITERRRAELALARYATRLSILHDIDRAILSAQSPEEIAEAAVVHIQQAVNPHRLMVLAFDPETGAARTLAVVVQGATQLATGTILPPEDILGMDQLRARKTVVIEDLAAYTVSPAAQTLLAEGVRAITNIPFFAQNRLIGLIGLGHNQPNAFSAEHIDIIREIGDQIAIAITQAHLYAAEREQRKLAEALAQTSNALISSLSLDAVMNTLLENVSRVVPHDAANIMLIENDLVRIAHWRGYHPERNPFLQEFSLPLAETLHLRRMSDTQSPYLISHTDHDPNWVHQPHTEWVKSYVAAPIRSHGNVIGFLNVDSGTPGFYTETHAQHLQTFADQASVAIEHAQLYEQIQRHANELEQRVTERTAQLNHAKERVEAILNSGNDVMILCRTDGRINQVNPAFYATFQRNPDEVYGQPLTRLAVPEHTAKLEQAFVDVVENQHPRRFEITVHCPHRAAFDADIVLSPIVGHDKMLMGVVCSLRDMTDHKQMQERLRQMLEHEIKLSELKSRYVAMAAHDLRNPLAVIQSAVSLMHQYGDRLSEEKTQQKYDDIQTSIQVMVDMLDDILTLGTVESGKLMFDPASLDVVALCQNIVTEIGQAAVPITSRILFSSQGNCSIACMDAKLLRHILGNLLSNAVKYSPEDRPVTFTLHCEPDQIAFCVQDQGIGIPKADQKRLFETFHRASNARQIPGTGLGLAIVKQSVELHGGTITFESEEGHGTIFTVIIPHISSREAHEKNSGH